METLGQMKCPHCGKPKSTSISVECSCQLDFSEEIKNARTALPKHRFSISERGVITLCTECDKVISNEESEKLFCDSCKEEQEKSLIKRLSEYNPDYVGIEQFHYVIKRAKELSK